MKKMLWDQKQLLKSVEPDAELDYEIRLKAQESWKESKVQIFNLP